MSRRRTDYGDVARREILAFPFEVKNLDLEERIVEGYAAVFGNIDYWNDVIHPGAFAKSLMERGQKVKLLWQHFSDEVLGPVLLLREDAKGLFIRAKVSRTSLGDEVMELLKDGAVDGFSIGYDTITADEERMGDKIIRHLRELKLWEVSLVTFPANPQALITAVKSISGATNLPLADRNRDWDAAAAEGRVRELAGGDPEADDFDWPLYRKAFFWYDQDAPQAVGSYKLPFADVIDGRLHAVPKGIFAVAAVLQGARGGVDIPEQEQAGIKRKVVTYYTRMRREFDDETIVAPWEKAIRCPSEGKELTDDGAVVRRLGDALQGAVHQTFTLLCDHWYQEGLLTRDQRVQLSGLIGEALGTLSDGIPAEVAEIPLQVIPDWLGWVTTQRGMGWAELAAEGPGEGKEAPGEPADTGPAETPLQERIEALRAKISEARTFQGG